MEKIVWSYKKTILSSFWKYVFWGTLNPRTGSKKRSYVGYIKARSATIV